MWREKGPRISANPLRELFDAAARGYNLKLTCGGCGRAEVLNRFAVWWLFQRKGWRDRLGDVPARFRCGSCSCKAPQLDLVHEEPTSDALAVPQEREWKRELRRRR
jgi:hypothetical protein